MTTTPEPLGPKDPEEIKVLSFPFARELAGASISTIDYVTPSTYKGTDPTPAAVALGIPVVSGTNVLQRMQAGLDGVIYGWRAKVTDSNGNKHVMSLRVQVKTQVG
jgi:hypothetical protein